MSTIAVGHGRFLGLAVGLLLAFGVSGIAAGATATWTGATSTSWGTASNWSWASCTGCGAPGSAGGASGADVVINSGSVKIAASVSSIGNIDIHDGEVSFSGGSNLTATGNFTMSGGTFLGGTGDVTIGGNLTLNATDGLIGAWSLDELASPSVDSSGNGYSLIWTGAPTVSSSVPSGIVDFPDTHSLSMMGGGQYASGAVLSGVANLRPTVVSMSAWYKATSTDTTGSGIVSGSDTYALAITPAGVTVIKRIHDGASQDWIEYRAPVARVLDGSWHQIVGVISTGTGGGMTVYFDGVLEAGTYFANGAGGVTSIGAGPETSALDYDAATETFGLNIGRLPSTPTYDFGVGCAAGACAIDEVRIYNRKLSQVDVSSFAVGRHPGTMIVGDGLSVTGNLTVSAFGTLKLVGSTARVSMGNGKTLTVDGTLDTSSATTGPTIQSLSGSYAFTIGSTIGATPTLNISRLVVNNTDTNGMHINAISGAVTTFVRFDNLAFGAGTAGTGTALLQIFAPTLYLSSQGCTFDGSTTFAVKLIGNGGQTRAVFAGATCATNAANGLCATSEKSDDDANNDGVADSPGNGVNKGAVVQFTRAVEDDTTGTIIGFPTAAFDWSTFTYYSTYVTFHDASAGTNDVVYVRGSTGAPLYSWTAPTAAEAIIGTPQWTTVGSTHYLYVATNGTTAQSGKIYRLIDNGSTSLVVDAAWGTADPYSCTCTIQSPLSLDASNLYWAGSNATPTQLLYGIGQTSQVAIKTGWPITTPLNVTTSSPQLWTRGGITTLYLGIAGDLLQLDVTGTTLVTNTQSGSVTGRVSVGTSALATTSGTSRVYAGDTAGTMWAISPTSFTGTNFLWSYAAGSAINGSSYYDNSTDTIQFGTQGGKIVALTGAGSGTSGVIVNSSYPYTLSASDPITSAPLYYNGVLAVGTTLGKLYFLDRNTGNATAPAGVSIVSEYSFGPTESVSGVAFDSNTNRYMVSTSSLANDGRLYYFDLVADPTPSFK
jgi:hypothetical protein